MRIKRKSTIKLESPVPVFDIEVANTNNFKIKDGCFVHNSKDVSDAVCQLVYNAHIDPHFHENLFPHSTLNDDGGMIGIGGGYEEDEEMRKFIKWSRK